jgi:hypothetical protein
MGIWLVIASSDELMFLEVEYVSIQFTYVYILC